MLAWNSGESKDEITASVQARQAKTTSKSRRTPPETQAWTQQARKLARTIREDRLAALLAAMAHPMRLKIVYLLLEGPATHRHLTKATGLNAGPLYHHIRELRQAGIIGPKSRDLYTLTRSGHRMAMILAILQKVLM